MLKIFRFIEVLLAHSLTPYSKDSMNLIVISINQDLITSILTKSRSSLCIFKQINFLSINILWWLIINITCTMKILFLQLLTQGFLSLLMFMYGYVFDIYIGWCLGYFKYLDNTMGKKKCIIFLLTFYCLF